MAKLYRAGIGDVYLNFLNAYLEPRIGRVTIAGVFSDAFQISDSVFQGTVLGPTLWNVFPPRHNKQLDNGRSQVVFSHAIFNRSLFGLVDIYNRLPQDIIDRPSFKEFQYDLTYVAKCRCVANMSDWKLSFNAYYHSNHAFVSV